MFWLKYETQQDWKHHYLEVSGKAWRLPLWRDQVLIWLHGPLSCDLIVCSWILKCRDRQPHSKVGFFFVHLCCFSRTSSRSSFSLEDHKGHSCWFRVHDEFREDFWLYLQHQRSSHWKFHYEWCVHSQEVYFVWLTI